MTERLDKLREALCDAVLQVEDAKDRMMEYIGPVIRKFAAIDRLPGGYHAMEVYRDEVRITLRWSGRGGDYDTDYRIPLAVFKSVDAEAAAAEHQRKAAKEAERQRKAGIRAQIVHLQTQLASDER